MRGAEEHRQPTGEGKTALHQLERTCESEFAGVTGDRGFRFLIGIIQQIEADGLFVAVQGRDILNSSPHRQDELGGAGIKRQHLTGHLFEIRDAAIAQAHQRCECVTGRQRAIDVNLEKLGVILRVT